MESGRVLGSLLTSSEQLQMQLFLEKLWLETHQKFIILQRKLCLSHQMGTPKNAVTPVALFLYT